MHPAKAAEQNEMPFGRDILCVNKDKDPDTPSLPTDQKKIKVKVKVSICIAHLAYNALMRFSSLIRAASRTATTCNLQTQANATAG